MRYRDVLPTDGKDIDKLKSYGFNIVLLKFQATLKADVSSVC